MTSPTRLTVTAAIALGLATTILTASGCGSSAPVSAPTHLETTAGPTLTKAERRARAGRQAAARAAALRAARARLIAAQRRADAQSALGTLTSYTESDFDIDYPSGWDVSTSSSGGASDTTIRSSDGLKLIRVDIQSNTTATDPNSAAAPVEQGLEPQPDYKLLGWKDTTFAGYPALRWEFTVSENGVLLRKVDTFFIDSAGNGTAVLVQAPAAGYQYWQPVFSRVRSSFTTNESVAAPEPTPSPAAPSGGVYAGSFCETHVCIASFDQGDGYIVQCADGEWSHSGGLPGACSWHGGETGNSYDGSDSGSGTYVAPPPPPTGQDLGPGNGYPVICADGSVSNSGGIQGACSHHGGVG